MRLASSLVIGMTALLLVATSAVGEERTLRVGSKEVPPFAMRDASGDWTGISIELWREFARERGLAFEIVEMDLPELLAGLEDGSLDVAAAALTITSEREERFDFSHAFVISGLGMAVKPREGVPIARIVEPFLDAGFLRGFLLGLAALALTSVAVWILESRKNPEQFGGGAVSGIGSGLWWSVVTMTTVGYGDKAPATAAGRVLAVVWMIAGVILISALTASITSALTVSQLAAVGGLEDLDDQPAATVGETRGAEFLRIRGIRAVTLESLEECVDALEAGRVAAIVYDKPVLQHFAVSNPDRPLLVLPDNLERWGYGIGLPTRSPLREPLNRFLLGHVNSTEWERVVARHLGR